MSKIPRPAIIAAAALVAAAVTAPVALAATQPLQMGDERYTPVGGESGFATVGYDLDDPACDEEAVVYLQYLGGPSDPYDGDGERYYYCTGGENVGLWMETNQMRNLQTEGLSGVPIDADTNCQEEPGVCVPNEQADTATLP